VVKIPTRVNGNRLTPCVASRTKLSSSVAALAGSVSQPRNCFGKAEEVATAVAFLASDDASYITGVELAIGGGRSHL